MGRRTVLVTGAAGTIGRAAVAGLGAAGWRVIAFSLDFASPVAGADELITGDATREPDVAAALAGVDAVVHLAALPHWLSGTPGQVFTTNVTSTFTVLHQAAERGVDRAVIASSIHASGIPAHRRSAGQPYYPLDVDTPIDHDDWYSLSKFVDERTAAMIASHWGMRIVAFRFPAVTSTAHLAKLRQRWSADPATGVRLGWSYLDQRDAAEAIRLGLENAPTGATICHVAAPEILIDLPTDELLDHYAPDAERRVDFPGRTTPIDLSPAEDLLGFRAQHLLPYSSEDMDR